MLQMSTSQFKLPHYIKIIFPLFAIITAKAIYRLIEEKRNIPNWVRISFYVICAVYVLAGILLNVWAFPLNNLIWIIAAFAAVAFLIFIIFYSASFSLKLLFVTMLTAGFVNFILNTNFFPQVLSYQGSSRLAEYVNRNNIPKNDIFGFTDRSYYAFDFYIQKDVREPGIDVLKQLAVNNETFYILTDKEKLTELKAAIIPMQPVNVAPHFHVSSLNIHFLNPNTRAFSLDSLWLMKVN